jgi:hypothetical protein
VPGSVKKGWYKEVFMKFQEKRQEWIDTWYDVQPIDPETGENFPLRIKPLDKKLPACLKGLVNDINQEIT